MAVYERDGQGFMPERDNFDGYTWVIGRDKVSIAIDDGSTQHRDVAAEAGYCHWDTKFPIVGDGGRFVFTSRKGWTIVKDVTTSTSPEALQGLERNTPEYYEAFRNMRRVSTQMVATLIGEPVTAEFPDGTSEQFFPQDE